MPATLIHGFAGGPWVWDAVAIPDARAIAIPLADSWDGTLAALGDDHDLVIGYSLGARLALGLLATGRAKRGILISVNPGIPDADRAARRASDAAWAAMLRERGLAAFLDAWNAQPLFRDRPRDPRRDALDPETLARMLETTGLAEMPDYRGAIDDLPCTLVVGANDAKFRALAQATARPVIEIPGSGHDPTVDQPIALGNIIASLRVSSR